jgi:hypothetical protein
MTTVLLFSCKSVNSDYRLNNTKTENVVKRCKNIEDTNFVVPKGLLVGKWKEYFQWTKQDSTWIGMKPLNLIHEYEIFPNGKIVFKETDIESSRIVWLNRLRGFINKSRNKLYVLKNPRNDTIFIPGELLKKETKRIHLLNDTLLRIDEHFFISGNYKLIIVDYRRVDK